jgi:hypothetical protein
MEMPIFGITGLMLQATQRWLQRRSSSRTTPLVKVGRQSPIGSAPDENGGGQQSYGSAEQTAEDKARKQPTCLNVTTHDRPSPQSD